MSVSLLTAITLWKTLPKASMASFQGNQWKFGGAFAGFVFVLLTLIQSGPLQGMKETISDHSTIYASVVDMPSTAEDYEAILGGFSNTDLFLMNVDYSIENSGQHVFQAAINLMETQINDNVTFRCLYFDKALFQGAKPFFNALKQKVSQPVFDKAVDVSYVDDVNHMSSYQFLLGYKGDVPVVIFDIGDDKLFVVKGSDSLYTTLHAYFTSHWED